MREPIANFIALNFRVKTEIQLMSKHPWMQRVYPFTENSGSRKHYFLLSENRNTGKMQIRLRVGEKTK
jgi:hypothetical protein